MSICVCNIHNGIDEKSTCKTKSKSCAPIKNNGQKLTQDSFEFSENGLHITSLNIQHLLPKLDELTIHLNRKNSTHILGLCETFIGNNISNADIHIKNYNIERRDRANKNGGGIVIYINDKTIYKRRNDLEINDIESVWLEIMPQFCKSFLLNFIYRPPSSKQSWIDLYNAQVELVDSLCVEYYILGDVNINYDAKTSTFDNQKWLDLTNKFDIKQLIKLPTRVTKKSSKIIDHIYANETNNIANVFVPSLSLSDHYPVCFTRSISNNTDKTFTHKTITYRCFKTFNEEKFQNDLLINNIDYVEQISDPNDAIDTFYSILNSVLSKHAPLRQKRIKRENQPIWFSEDIKALIYERDKCHKNGNHNQYKYLRNKITYLIKKSKRDFFNKAIKDKKDVRFLWKNLKDITKMNKNNSVKIPSQLCVNDKIVNDDINILSELNKHFTSISKIAEQIKTSDQNWNSLKRIIDTKLKHKTFEINFITPFEVKKIIEKLDNNKSTGLDGIGPKVIKQCGDTITIAIASIINKSINKGIFPDKLKCARVLPLFKSGSRDDPNNYRPISILPTISKIFEKHVAKQIQSYFRDTQIIHIKQSGFRNNHSCSTALTSLIDAWVKDIDSGKLVGAVFLDLRKAFDLVNHDILLNKLKLYHFSENTIKFFKSYLSGRQQLVEIGRTRSEPLLVTSGVPQGSILGPLLFLLYINDLALSNNDINIDLFADDSTVYKPGVNLIEIETKLQADLNCIQKWCKNNGMVLHPGKSKCMIMGTPNRTKQLSDLHLEIHGTYIESVTVQKLLGVYIDNNLKWHAQTDYVCKRMISKISLLKRVSFYLTQEMKCLFYNAYILPIFDYCCHIWGNGSSRNMNRIHSLQRRIAKIILRNQNQRHSINVFIELRWLKFEDRCKYHAALLVFKARCNLVPEYISSILEFHKEEHYSLRSSTKQDLRVNKQIRTNYFKQSFTYFSMKVWNNIPCNIRSAKTVSAFKLKYKTYLLENYKDD